MCESLRSVAPDDNLHLFCHYSVATTTTKPPAVFKTDIRRLLDRMQVQYKETKTGFDCIHLPSIDISSLQDPHGISTPSPRKHSQQGSAGSGDSGGTTRRIVQLRKASKLAFGMSYKGQGKDRTGEMSVNGSTHKEKKEKELPSRPSGGTGLGPGPGPSMPTFGATQSSGSSSFFNVPFNAPTVQPNDDSPGRRSNSPARSKTLPPIPRDFAAATPQPRQVSPPPTGEVTDPEVFESIGQNTLSVRFEINIVKVRAKSFSSFLHFIIPGPGPDSDFFSTSHGCRYMESNSAVRAETDGSTRCSPSSSDGAKALIRYLHVIRNGL